MSIDWQATGSILSGLGTLVGAGAVLVAAWVGRESFQSWKAQKVEERRMDVAERILVLAYSLQSAIDGVRSRGMFERETETARTKLEKDINFRVRDHAEQSQMTTAQVILDRLSTYQDDWQQVWALKPLALALFGKDVEQSVHSFWSIRADLESLALELAEHDPTVKSEGVRIRRALFGGDGDIVTPKLSEAVAFLEAKLLPVLRTSAI